MQIVPVHPSVDPPSSISDRSPDGDLAAVESGGHVGGRAGGVEALLVKVVDDGLQVHTGGIADEGLEDAREGILGRLSRRVLLCLIGRFGARLRGV
ncbi:hypothetical protein CFC35_05685 [Streptomyces sp. FBKL.4005]|nr:hypothetical protein CFC35_05685 [Streptomyces sp. FBKL.4005]